MTQKTAPMRRVKSLLFLLVVVSVAIIFGPWRSVGAKADRPNILIIVADDLGYADVGVNGCKDVPTPNIDSLARNGVRFTNGYVSGPYCSPTRAALLTGRYQQRFGHEFNPGPEATADPNFGLPLTETTLADRLKAAGYATALVGKWHLGYRPEFHPQKRGFDEFFGFLGGAHSYLHNNDGAIMRGTEPVRQMTYTTDMFGDEAVSFIERHRGKPWFLYLAFNADHGPMEAAERYMPRVSHIQDPLRRTFAAMHTALDDNVGRVLTLLHKQRLEENTLIFFFSDNGGPTRVNASRNNPLRGFKAQTWEGGIRIPFIVQWKGKLPSGKVYDYPVIQMDIPVTSMMAARVDIKPEWKLDGVDLLPYLNRKNKARPHGALYWRFGPQLAIRESEWKLVRAPGAGADFIERRTPASTEGAHLYNLATDIGEQNNLAEREPDKVRHLAAAWEAWNRELEQPRWIPGNANRAQRQRR